MLSTFYLVVPFALANGPLCAELWGTPVGTRVWTRRKPRELSSMGSPVPMYIPSVGGKYWFYLADMTTICHRVPVPFVYTRTRSHEVIPGASREVGWNIYFVTDAEEGPVSLAWGRLGPLMFERRYWSPITVCFVKKHRVERKQRDTGRYRSRMLVTKISVHAYLTILLSPFFKYLYFMCNVLQDFFRRGKEFITSVS